MSALARQHAAFWSAVRTTASGDLATHFQGRGALDAAARMEIYRTAYWCRQVEALRELFPSVVSQLGDGPFAREASRFIAAHPSEHWSIEGSGAAFPPWLAPRAPTLAQVASVDWARWQCFVAVDEVPLRATDLTPLAIATLELHLAQHVAMLRLGAPAAALVVPTLEWSSVRSTLVIWRMGFEVHQLWVDDLEASALAATTAGIGFEAWCEVQLGTGADAQQIHATLTRWISLGWLSAGSSP